MSSTVNKNINGGTFIDWLAPVRSLQEAVFFPYRHERLTKRLAPHLRDVETALDVGTSCGKLAQRLMEASGCRITGIDVHLQPDSSIEAYQYDGVTFPFPDKSFDCVMMVDMLHHSSDIERMFKEARRVARHYVLVKDHYWDTIFDKIGLYIADYLGNAPYGIALPYRYLRIEEWLRLFCRHGLRMLTTDFFRLHPLEPCRHIVVKLQAA